MLGVDGRPFGTSPGTPRNPAEPHGTVKLGNYDWGPEFYGFVAHRFGLPSAPPARGGFVYLSFPRWVLGVDGRPFGTPPGTPWNGKIGKLRIESGILRSPGSALRFSFCVAHPRRFRLFIISALGVDVDGRPFRTPPGTPRNPTEPHWAVNLRNYNYDPEFYGFLARHFGFLSASPTGGGFVYLSFPRWVLGVDGRPFGTPPGTPRNPTER